MIFLELKKCVKLYCFDFINSHYLMRLATEKKQQRSKYINQRISLHNFYFLYPISKIKFSSRKHLANNWSKVLSKILSTFTKLDFRPIANFWLRVTKYRSPKNDFIVVVVVVVGVLTNFYHIFKESDYFESLVETCPKRKSVVGAA